MNTDDPSDVFWRSISSANVTTLYGKSPARRLRSRCPAATLIPLVSKAAEAVSVVVNLFPDVQAGSPTTAGFQFGGSNNVSSGGWFARHQETIATILSVTSMLANRTAKYVRGRDDWDEQAELATIELKQTLDLAASRFPYFVQGRNIRISLAKALAKTRSEDPLRVTLAPGTAAAALTAEMWTSQDGPGLWTFATDADPATLEDLYLILGYGVS